MGHSNFACDKFRPDVSALCNWLCSAATCQVFNLPLCRAMWQVLGLWRPVVHSDFACNKFRSGISALCNGLPLLAHCQVFNLPLSCISWQVLSSLASRINHVHFLRVFLNTSQTDILSYFNLFMAWYCVACNCVCMMLTQLSSLIAASKQTCILLALVQYWSALCSCLSTSVRLTAFGERLASPSIGRSF